MERNWPATIAALRRKAADPVVGEKEREALTAKADKLAEKYNVVESNRTIENGYVPTWDEFVTSFFNDVYRSQTTEHVTFFGGSARGKSHFTDEWLKTQAGSHFVFYDGWYSDIDEDTSQNGNYEFPQEGY